MTLLHPLFSIPVYQSKIEFDNNELLNKVLSSELVCTNKNSNCKRTVNQDILLDANYSDLYDKILEKFYDYVYKQLKLDCKFKCVCSWAVVGNRGSITDNHLHPNSIFSGIYYIKSNKDNGDLIFSVPQTHNTISNSVMEMEVTDYNIFNSKVWKFTPHTGDIFIFPSHLYHGVSENKSDEIRCGISFNFFVDGKVSTDPTSKLNV